MFNKLVLLLATVAIFAVTPALAQPTGCNKIKFQGTYTRTYELPKVVGIGNTTYLMTLELRADRTAARHETSALDYIINSGTGSPGVGSWTCRADGKLVVTILRALYTPIAADIARVEAPNADVQLYRHLRTTHLFNVEDVNTITQIQVRNRFYNATLNQDPTDPTAGTLGLLRTTSTVFTRLTASDADLLP